MTLRRYYISNQIYGVKYGIKSNSRREMTPTLYNTTYYKYDKNLKAFCIRIFNSASRRYKTVSEYYRMRESDERSFKIVNGDKYIMKRYMHDEDCATISMESFYDFSTLSMRKRGLI